MALQYILCVNVCVYDTFVIKGIYGQRFSSDPSACLPIKIQIKSKSAKRDENAHSCHINTKV